MNRLVRLLGLVLVLLAGCAVQVGPTPPSKPPSTSSLKVVSASVATNYRTTDGTWVICDNRTTTLTYAFRYAGKLARWTSYLRGQTLGETKGRLSFTPSSQGVTPLGKQRYEVRYVIHADFAPYLNGDGAIGGTFTPGAVNVVPVPKPTHIGATKLYLILQGGNREARFVSNSIPVVINCPSN